MKILMITPYVTINTRPEFSRNKTGFGYMVLDIARAVGKLEKVEVLATDSRGVDFDYEGVNFLQRSYGLFISSLFYSLSPFVVVRLWKQYHMKSGTLLRMMYYWLLTGYLRKLLKSRQYDVVHIHGCGFGTELWIQVCKKCNQKFIVTLHGLNSFSDTVKLEAAGKRYERDFLSRVVAGEFSITVISTGMKRLIENTYNTKECPNITVVCNSFSFFLGGGKVLTIKKLYHLEDNCKVVVCVGNISERKNQKQLISAFNHLSVELAKKTYILFLGGNQSKDYTIENLAKDSVWGSHFVACGIIPKEEVGNYYHQCDGIALMSLSEGFGLSLIEGMHFGKPSMSFTDVDAYTDIYNPVAMVGVEEHSDEAVAEGLEKLLTTKWDSIRIKDYSKKFESHQMANNYLNVYQRKIRYPSEWENSALCGEYQ